MPRPGGRFFPRRPPQIIVLILLGRRSGEQNMEEERIGFVGIVIEDLSQAARVNQVVGQFQELVMGRIGVPDHARAMAVIGLLVRGGSVQVGAFAARLGNIPGVQVKSALTKERKEISHEKAD